MVTRQGNLQTAPLHAGYLLRDGEEAHYCHELSIALAIQDAMRAICGRTLSIHPLGSHEPHLLARRHAR